MENIEPDEFGHEWELTPHVKFYTCGICSARRYGTRLNEWTWWSSVSGSISLKNKRVPSFYCKDELVRTVLSQ